MARTISWLPRVHEISRSVAQSARSHYDRRDLQTLFELQPRAAQKMLEMLPHIAIGTSRLVERDALAGFLERVGEADDLPALFERIRGERSATSRKRPRSIVRRDVPPASLDSLPEVISLTRGRLEVRFLSVEHLAESLYTLARVLEDEGEAFTASYEPAAAAPGEPEDGGEIERMLAELRTMEGAPETERAR